jgi:cytochrome c553
MNHLDYRDPGSGVRDQLHVRSTSNAVILSVAQRSRRICGCVSRGFDRLFSRVPQVSILRPGIVLASLTALLLLAGCRQDMHDQPKMFPQRGSNVFADHRGARPQVVNTVARGQLREDSYYYTGVAQGANGYREEHDQLPFPVTMEVLQRGQERFNIYCTPCHSRVGNGLGEIVQRGYKPAANLHDQVRLAQPLSHYFYVMTNGYGAMPDYSAQLTPADRWAVAAYIRALQLSQNAKESDVPSGVQVQNLKDAAASENLSASYAEPWSLPATAVQPYPHDWKQGWPAGAPANPADPKQLAPAKPATGAAQR